MQGADKQRKRDETISNAKASQSRVWTGEGVVTQGFAALRLDKQRQGIATHRNGNETTRKAENRNGKAMIRIAKAEQRVARYCDSPQRKCTEMQGCGAEMVMQSIAEQGHGEETQRTAMV